MTATTPKTSGRRRSLGTRLSVPVFVLILLVAVGVYAGLVRSYRTTLMQSKEAAVDMVVRLTALSVMPAVVFGDEVEMRRAVTDLGKNPDVTAVELWSAPSADAPESTLLSSFQRGKPAALGKPSGFGRVRAQNPDAVLALEPVIGTDGKVVALLSTRFSTAPETRALSALTRQILFVAAGTAFGLVLALLLVIRRLAITPLRRLQQAAQRLALGETPDFGEPLGDQHVEDEVVELGSAFRTMAFAVRDRERQLSLRNTELSLILNSVEQGFLTILPDGVLLEERSAILDTWVGKLPPGAHYWDLITRLDPGAAFWAEAAWQQAMEGLFPLDAALDQLPRRLTREQRHFDLMYHPVMVGNEIARVVLVVTDVTAEVERQRALAEQHEFSVLVDQFVRDRRAFHGFWKEASTLVARIAKNHKNPDESLRRDIHTLKGNSRFFGLPRIASLCHELEEAMAERRQFVLTEVETERLAERWESLRQRIDPLMRGATAFVEVSQEEYERLAQAVNSREGYERLADLVVGLRNEPTEWRLRRAKEQLESLFKKLGKASPLIRIEHHELRLPPGKLAPFWSVFSHVLNNAADHGIESDDERRRSGKPTPARITLARPAATATWWSRSPTTAAASTGSGSRRLPMLAACHTPVTRI